MVSLVLRTREFCQSLRVDQTPSWLRVRRIISPPSPYSLVRSS